MAEIELYCPHCNQKLNVDEGYAGQELACPSCNGAFTVPAAAPPKPKAPRLLTPPPPQQAPPQPQYAPPQQAPPQPQYAPPQQVPAQPGYAPPQPGYAPPQPGYPPQQPGVPGYQDPYAAVGRRTGIGTVFANPLKAQPEFIETNPPGAAMQWGWILCGAWIVASWLFSWRMGSAAMGMFAGLAGPGMMRGAPSPEFGFSDHLRWIVGAIVPILFLVLAFLGLNASGSKRGRFGSILFTSGMVLIPLILLGVFMTLVTFIEVKSEGTAKTLMHLAIIVFSFGLSALILMIQASLTTIIGFSRKAAFWLVPTVLVAVGYLTKWTLGLVAEIFD